MLTMGQSEDRRPEQDAPMEGRPRTQSLPAAPVMMASASRPTTTTARQEDAQPHHTDPDRRRLSDLFLSLVKPRSGSITGGEASSTPAGQLGGGQGRRGSHQGSVGSGPHTAGSITGGDGRSKTVGAGGGGVTAGMRRHSFQVNPVDAQVLATYERVNMQDALAQPNGPRMSAGSETPAHRLSDLGLPAPPPLKGGGAFFDTCGGMEDVQQQNLPQKEEDFSEPNCLICLSKFTQKRPPIQIPCSAKCNSAPVHARCIYEWKEQRGGGAAAASASAACGSCPLCRAPLQSLDYVPPDPLATKTLFMHSARRSFVSRPAPKSAGMVRCYIRIVGTGPVTSTPVRYEMWLQAPTTRKYPNVPLPPTYGTSEGDQLLMTARRRTNMRAGGCSVIDVSLDREGKDFSRRGNAPNYLASVRGSLFGLDYTITAPCRFAFQAESSQTLELGSVRFEQNRVGSGAGPRRISICLPSVREDPSPMDPWPPAAVPEEEKDVEQKQSTTATTTTMLDASSGMEVSAAKRDATSEEEEDEDGDEDSAKEEMYRTVEYVPQSKSQSLRRLVRTRCPPVSAAPVNAAPAAAIAQTPHGGNHHPTATANATAAAGPSANMFASDQFIFARNRKPYYLESISAFSLDFYGRVTLPSNKNCLLTCEDANSSTATPESNILLFGKIGIKGRNADAAVYTLDFQWPLSPLQAFGIALASCDRKFACA